jgi:hypothetical protein
MADYLANTAMDNQHSTTASTTWTPIDEQLCLMIAADTQSPITPIDPQKSGDLLLATKLLIRRRTRPIAGACLVSCLYREGSVVL